MLDGVQWPSSGESEITTRYTRARMRTLQEFCIFCCHKCHTNSITHYVITIYIDFRNNIPQCHTFTLLLAPQKSPKHHPQNNFSISNLKQHVVFSKTIRHFPQNDTLFSIKRHVTFHKTIRCFWDDEVFSIPSTVTLVTAKKIKLLVRERAYARVRTPSANTKPSPHPIKPINPLLHPSESPSKKHSPTKKYSSAMKQPSTNQQ